MQIGFTGTVEIDCVESIPEESYLKLMKLPIPTIKVAFYLWAVYQNSKFSKDSHVKMEALGKTLKISHNSFSKALKELSNAGIITVTKDAEDIITLKEVEKYVIA
ncbi:MAG: hypothetical protein ACYDEF_08580 [Methanosarcina sp.]